MTNMTMRYEGEEEIELSALAAITGGFSERQEWVDGQLVTLSCTETVDNYRLGLGGIGTLHEGYPGLGGFNVLG